MQRSRADIEAAVTALAPELARRLGRDDAVSRSDSVREHHARGEGLPDAAAPDAVAFPRTNEEVSLIVSACNDAGIPVIPYGTGTSLEGQIAAIRGGICLDLSRMDRILEVSEAGLDARVQAGVTRETLNRHLRDTGLYFPVDPGADASLGGMAATRASGTAAVRYGTMRDNVLGLTVVTADGRVVRTGSRARKSATGYDLTGVFVGSEGTLGVITEVQLRLYGRPETELAAVCQFPSVEAALEVTVGVLQSGIQIGRIELLNAMQMRMAIRYSSLEGYEPLPTLFMQFQGGPAAVREQVEFVEALCGDEQLAEAHREVEHSRRDLGGRVVDLAVADRGVQG